MDKSKYNTGLPECDDHEPSFDSVSKDPSVREVIYLDSSKLSDLKI